MEILTKTFTSLGLPSRLVLESFYGYCVLLQLFLVMWIFIMVCGCYLSQWMSSQWRPQKFTSMMSVSFIHSSAYYFNVATFFNSVKWLQYRKYLILINLNHKTIQNSFTNIWSIFLVHCLLILLWIKLYW